MQISINYLEEFLENDFSPCYPVESPVCSLRASTWVRVLAKAEKDINLQFYYIAKNMYFVCV